MERLLGAVEVLGEGRVISNFVLGVELAPPYGFKSEDEGAASYLEGCEWMLKHGVDTGGATWRPAPGTIFEGLPGPRTEYFLRLRLAQKNLYLKYKRAPKTDVYVGQQPPASFRLLSVP